jgi:hypothetical protein
MAGTTTLPPPPTGDINPDFNKAATRPRSPSQGGEGDRANQAGCPDGGEPGELLSSKGEEQKIVEIR